MEKIIKGDEKVVILNIGIVQNLMITKLVMVVKNLQS